MAALINPLGNFPLNDDWAYAYTVQELLEHGRYTLSSWGMPTLLAQALWGLLFCLFTGFSFTALRFSTLALGLIGISAFYMTLREVGVKRRSAWVGTCMLMMNPLYICLSYSFMTDIPFLSFSLVSLYFFLRFSNTACFSQLLLAALFACASALIRQFGILLPLAFGLAHIKKHGFNRRAFFHAVLPTVITASALSLYYLFLTLSGNSQVTSDTMPLTGMFRTMAMYNMTIVDIFSRNVEMIAFAFLYLGMFLLPLLLLKVTHIYKISSKEVRIKFTLLSVFLAAIIFYLRYRLPISLLPNIIYNFGLGPLIIPYSGCTYSLEPYLPEFVKYIFCFISAILAGVFCAWLHKAQKESSGSPLFLNRLALYFCLLYATALLFHIISGVELFDRYLLPFLPLLILVLASSVEFARLGKLYICILGIWLILISAFSVAGTHDYLSANRTVWNALSSLQAKNIAPERIEGGFEFDSWYLYNKLHPNTRPPTDNNCRFDFTNYTKPYAVAFFAVKNYDVCQQLSYSRWLDLDRQPVYLLRKDTSFSCP